MYMFSRVARLSGSRMRAGIEWAVEITELVRRTTALEVGLWSEVFSPGAGNLVWSTTVPDLQTLETAFDKLAVENHYHDLTDTGMNYCITGSVADYLSTLIHPTEMAQRDDIEYVSVTTAHLAPGHMAEGIGVAVEIAQRVETVTGYPTLVTVANTGNYGAVDWIGLSPNLTESEKAEAALNADEEFIRLIDTKASTCFQAGVGATTTAYYRRLL